MNQKIQETIDKLFEEQFRAKEFLNNNGFDCTTATFVIVKEYRDAIKKHIRVLKGNLA